MAESIKLRMPALSIHRDAKELRIMFETILADMAALRTGLVNVVSDLTTLRTRSNTLMLSPAGLVIGTASKKVPKSSKPFMAMVNGTLVFLPVDTAMSTLGSSTVAQNKFALWAFYTDSTGTITTSTVTADANTAALAFAAMPAVPANKAQIGAIIVTNSAGSFVAVTDDLDKAGNTVIYIDNVGNLSASAALSASTPAALGLVA
jgi:hypothetical protein